MRAGRLRALIALAALAAPATAAPRRVGIAVALTVNVAADEADRLAGALGAALTDALAVEVVAGEAARARLADLAISATCVAEAACVDAIAARLQVTELVVLSVVRVGERIKVDPTWVDTVGEVAVPHPSIEIASLGDAAPRFAAVAADLLPERTRPPVEAPAPAGRRMTAGAWIAVGVGAAALVGGVGFTLEARSDYRALEARCAPGCSDRELAGLRRAALTADLLIAGAAASAVAALALYFTSAETVAPTGARLAPGPAPIGLSLSWER